MPLAASAHARPRLEAGDGGGAGVAEEVQDAHVPSGLPDLFHGPVPVRSLLRKKAGVLEVHGLDVEAELPIADLPGRWQTSLVPAAAAGFAAAIAGVPVVPVGVAARRLPDGLGVGADEIIVSPALQLLPPGAVQHFKIFPLIGDPHSSLHTQRIHSNSWYSITKPRPGQGITAGKTACRKIRQAAVGANMNSVAALHDPSTSCFALRAG